MSQVESVDTEASKSDAQDESCEVFRAARPVASNFLRKLTIAKAENVSVNRAVGLIGGLNGGLRAVAWCFVHAFVLPVISEKAVTASELAKREKEIELLWKV